jgi:metal-sulfur cluster biosynthetic enzyme
MAPPREARSDDRARGGFEHDPGEPVDPHRLDQRAYLRLGSAQQDRPPAAPQPPREHRQVEHQRDVGEPELGQIDDDIGLRAQGAGERATANSLRAAVLVAAAAEDRGCLGEVDDAGNLLKLKADKQVPGAVTAPGGANRCRSDRPRLAFMATVDEVTDALRDVIDPELGLDFVELGLIYEVAVDGGAVNVTYTLTAPGCPIGPQVAQQIEEFVSELDGVESVNSTMTFSPPWTPELMSDDAKFALGF